MIRKTIDSLRWRFRQRRYQRIAELMMARFSTGFVLDLGGGGASFFAALFPQPERVILLDVNPGPACRAKRTHPTLNVIVADGERLPFADRSIGVTICNSTIEHVNDPGALAEEMRRVSQAYFLQTPNGRFPIETHSAVAMPLYNLICWPGLQRLMCRVFGAPFEYVNSVRYLPEQRLERLFPNATVAYEKVLGLKKSFYVYCLGESTDEGCPA